MKKVWQKGVNVNEIMTFSPNTIKKVNLLKQDDIPNLAEISGILFYM